MLRICGASRVRWRPGTVAGGCRLPGSYSRQPGDRQVSGAWRSLESFVCCDRPKARQLCCTSRDKTGGADRSVRLTRVVYAIGRCVSTRKAGQRCEFSPSGTVLSPVERGILRMSSTRGRQSARHFDDRSDAKGFRAKRKPKEHYVG